MCESSVLWLSSDQINCMPAQNENLLTNLLSPAAIGLKTLELLVENDRWLDPARGSKIRRGDIYRIMGRSMVLVASNGMLRRWLEGLIAKVEERMQAIEQRFTS